ncbi:hypothetical protein [Arthrobacter sp. ok362]|uniref:hypothetical protein n=1 Tax=Arthrobacter sp. ok362 TaxID=1761745 RepID=UPI000B84628A|nr:hypothetical protein [Arthrobacter sp. ok362]
MTDAAFSAVTYVGLPIGSGGAHSLGGMSRRAAYEQATSFLETCTELVSPNKYTFEVHEVPDLSRQLDLEAELERRFGQGKRVAVPADRVNEALEWLDDIHPQPTNQWGMAPIWFRAQSSFRIVDPATGQVLPGQNAERFAGAEYVWSVPLGTSDFGLILDNSARLAIDLCIPDADGEMLRRVVPWLQDHLPFKLSAKQWRSWTPTKFGSFKSRRMAAPS